MKSQSSMSSECYKIQTRRATTILGDDKGVTLLQCASKDLIGYWHHAIPLFFNEEASSKSARGATSITAIKTKVMAFKKDASSRPTPGKEGSKKEVEEACH
ncbi:hypothetical protein ACFE04_000530 [Oxalis oulophora]